MKKIFITLIAVCLSITVSSCDANNGKSSEEKNCSEKNCGNDNSSEQQLQTPDLTLFGLKGNVKSVTDEIGNTYNFTKEGNLHGGKQQTETPRNPRHRGWTRRPS